MSDITHILSAIDQGDPSAAEQLLPLVYDELRSLAAQRLAHEKSGQTLEATALVHEAYIRLVGDQYFDNRSHFFAADAEDILQARSKNPDFLEQPASSLPSTLDSSPSLEPISAEQVDRPSVVLSSRYKLLEQIGEGGMGTVWMAQQQKPVNRVVAGR